MSCEQLRKYDQNYTRKQSNIIVCERCLMFASGMKTIDAAKH